MCNFLTTSLKPEIFWSALGSLGTLLAVAVALFWPLLNQYMKNNRIERLLREEAKGNFQKIKNMTSSEDRKLPGGVTITAAQNNAAISERVDLRLWFQFRYELAAERPESFAQMNSINMYAEEIIDAPNEPSNLRFVIQQKAAESYVSRCKELGFVNASTSA